MIYDYLVLTTLSNNYNVVEQQYGPEGLGDHPSLLLPCGISIPAPYLECQVSM